MTTKTINIDFDSDSETAILSPLLDQKIDEITTGLQTSYNRNLRLITNHQNLSIIVEYMQAMKIETNLSDEYRKNTIEALTRFCRRNNDKSFKVITRDDIIAFLETFRKSEIVDPLHRWIGTYNQYRMFIFRFFKWFYSPGVESKKRPNPSILENIPYYKRKEISTYKPSDLWTPEDDLLFLKYCPSKRDKFYHMASRDLSGRPKEILKLKIKDVIFKKVGNAQYAEVQLNGKTGNRTVPLINAIPYLKDYLNNEHPHPGNPNSPLICGVARGLGRHIKPVSMAHIYEEYKKKVFPKYLESPNISPEEKQKIRELLKKPWNPYIRRHSALTDKSKYMKESVLRQHSGWTPGSKMHMKYTHYYGNESTTSILEEYGLLDKGVYIDQLRPKNCTNCNEPNKPDTKFCVRCQMVLSYDAYEETLKEQEQQKFNMNEINKVLERIQALEDKIIWKGK